MEDRPVRFQPGDRVVIIGLPGQAGKIHNHAFDRHFIGKTGTVVRAESPPSEQREPDFTMPRYRVELDLSPQSPLARFTNGKVTWWWDDNAVAPAPTYEEIRQEFLRLIGVDNG